MANLPAIGVDIEPKFTTVAAANLDLAAAQGAILAARRARADGIPVSILAHEDVLVLRAAPSPGGSRESRPA